MSVLALLNHQFSAACSGDKIGASFASGEQILSGVIKGKVASVNTNGDLISDISNIDTDAAPRSESTVVRFAGHETFGLFPHDHKQPAATMVAKTGASGFIEIEIVGISLSEMLGIKPGTEIEVSW